MPSATAAELPIAPPAATSWSQRFAAMDRATRVRLAAGIALFVAMVVAAAFFASRSDYRVLFANLSDKDGGAIVAQLSQMNVPYKYAEGGGAIMVPADRVHDVRLRLASQGLPKGSITGFEVTETSRFGVTQFQERLNFQRGLEGELTRSIQALAPVQSARVHLALPNQNGFFREQQKPSASVLVSLYPGRFLDRTQLAGIVHLVASSVPELAPSAVSVLDNTGKLLSQPADGPGAGVGVDAEQLAYVQQIEQQYARRIVDILAPIVGRDNVNAQVTADVDFSQTESTTEQHRPNLAKDASAVRSQQIVESAGAPGAQLPAGVPGAVSNQPPRDANAPINGANPAPGATAQGAAGSGGIGHRELTTNYEVDKTTSVTRAAQGAIRRVNAAVVVNYANVPDGPGKPLVSKALAPEQIEQMTALVREAVGYNKERGDSVNLVNAPFKVDEVAPVELPLWKQPETIDLARSLGWPVGLSLAAVLLLIGVVRPALKSVTTQGAPSLPAPARRVDALASEQIERPTLGAPAPAQSQEPSETQLRLTQARALAKDNPAAVANIVKTWVNGE